MVLRAMNSCKLVLAAVLLGGLQAPLLAANVNEHDESTEFPGRALYPEVTVMDLDDLYRRLEGVIVVDVRSAYEYETLRIKDSINIPLSSKTFISRIRQLRESDTRPIVMYCNGKTCMKSYKAVRMCATNKIDNVHAYDAGIMDWARAYPEHAELLGKSPVDPKKLISKNEFKKHLLSPEAYGDQVANSSAIVLDVRDTFQREGLSIFVGRERRTHLDDKKKLDSYIDKAITEGKTLLVHDAAGQQVQWLQYYLKDKGLKSYYFMDGGAAAYYQQMKNESD